MHELARLLALLHVGTLTSFEALVFSRGAVVQPREEQARVGFFLYWVVTVAFLFLPCRPKPLVGPTIGRVGLRVCWGFLLNPSRHFLVLPNVPSVPVCCRIRRIPIARCDRFLYLAHRADLYRSAHLPE